jgi:hypothetical protein
MCTVHASDDAPRVKLYTLCEVCVGELCPQPGTPDHLRIKGKPCAF